jgi:uncharacterized membrane protein YheB (UPF0754 family)
METETWRLLLLPFAGLLIGWLTNYLAIKMLFHPKKPINLGLVSIQGVFPKRQDALGDKLGEVVSKELISTNEILDKVSAEVKGEEVHGIVERRIGEGLEKLIAGIPMASMFIDASMKQMARKAILDEFVEGLDEWMAGLKPRMEQNLDVKAIVKEKVSKFSSDKLEEVLYLIMKREFRFIEFAGGVLGFLIGCLQIFILTAGVR